MQCAGVVGLSNRRLRWNAGVHLGPNCEPYTILFYFPLLSIRSGVCARAPTINIVKVNTHSTCEIEDFVETRLCKLCAIL